MLFVWLSQFVDDSFHSSYSASGTNMNLSFGVFKNALTLFSRDTVDLVLPKSKTDRFVQFLNALSPIADTESGIDKYVNDLHWLSMLSGIDGISPRSAAVKHVQSANAESMMLETLGGICIDEMAVHRMNACLSIFRSVSGNSIDESLVQSIKAWFPIC